MDGVDPLFRHTPVLLEKVLEFLNPRPGGKYIDNTGGDGSMSRAILLKSSPDGIVLTIDCDPRTEAVRETNLKVFGPRSMRRRANFERMYEIAENTGILPVDGVLYDLGLSSRMVDDPSYGFSFMRSGPLDMRMDPSLPMSAWNVVNEWPEDELTGIFREMDESRWARRISGAIIDERRKNPIETTGQLAQTIESAIPRKFHSRKMHPATRAFLAIRVAVNREREALEASLRDCVRVLGVNGVLVVICYSSFEDRILRKVVREGASRWKKLTGKAVTPGMEEIEGNIRSRSARLRAYRKVA